MSSRGIRLACSIVISFACAADTGAAQSLPAANPESAGMSSERLDRIGEAMRREVADGRMPGAVIAVARRGKVVYHEAFGFLDKASGTPMPKDAIFSIASMTKPLATVGALALLEEGRLLLNDPVGHYLPQLAKPHVAVMSDDGATVVRTEAAKRPLTILDLMRHTAGVLSGALGTTELHKRYAAVQPRLNPDLTPDAFVARIGALPLAFQPGDVWDYGLGIDVLGVVVEKISGQPLHRFLDDRLFRPLAMSDTAFMVPPANTRRYARLTEAAIPTQERPFDATVQPKMDCAGACAVSTAMDYLRFAQMLLNKGTLDGARILGRKTVEAMTSNQLGPEVNVDRLRTYGILNGGYGFGLSVAVRRDSGVAGMPGSPGDYHWGGATGTYFWVDPKEELAVVFMAAAPATRLRIRQMLPALVLQAIAE